MADNSVALRVGIVAPIKQEAPYLLEWIAFHRALGIHSFYLADNGGSDGTSELLIALHEAGLIERHDWRGKEAPQIPFYLDIIPRLRGRVDICAIIDADEFLRPLGGNADIISSIAPLFARAAVSALAVSWAMYGSSGRIEPGNGLVLERFQYRAPDAIKYHQTIKTLVRPEALAGMLNPHMVALSGGSYINDCGDKIAWRSPGAATSFSWQTIRLDHFVLKSRREFEIKKKRGRPGGAAPVNDEFFISRDHNEVFDPMPAEFIARTKDEMIRITNRLKKLTGAVSA